MSKLSNFFNTVSVVSEEAIKALKATEAMLERFKSLDRIHNSFPTGLSKNDYIFLYNHFSSDYFMFKCNVSIDSESIYFLYALKEKVGLHAEVNDVSLEEFLNIALGI